MPDREAALRRKLQNHDLSLKKTPSVHWTRKHYGAGFMILDTANMVKLGCFTREYDASLDDVAEFASLLS